jgi:hypothetical protein
MAFDGQGLHRFGVTVWPRQESAAVAFERRAVDRVDRQSKWHIDRAGSAGEPASRNQDDGNRDA